MNASGSVVQTYDYYPFGLEMPGRSLTSGSTARERFTGHERDEEVGLDYMQARRYAAEFGRFLSVDPMAEKRQELSPFNYVQNNPLNRIDPTGELDKFLITEGSNTIQRQRQAGQDQFIYQDANQNVRQLDTSNSEDLAIIRDRLTDNDSFRNIISTESGTKAPIEVAKAAGEINIRKGVRQVIQTGTQIGEATGQVLQVGGAILGPAGAPIVGLGFGLEQASNAVGVFSGGKSVGNGITDGLQSVASYGTGVLLNKVAKGTLEQTITSNVVIHNFLLINAGIDQIQNEINE